MRFRKIPLVEEESRREIREEDLEAVRLLRLLNKKMVQLTASSSAWETWSARETRKPWRRSTSTNSDSRSLHLIKKEILASSGSDKTYSQGGRRSTTASRFGNSGSSSKRRRYATRSTLSESSTRIGWRRRFDGEGNDVSTANNGQTKSSLLLGLDELGR